MGSLIHTDFFHKNLFLGFFYRDGVLIYRCLNSWGSTGRFNSWRLGRGRSFNNRFLGCRLRIGRIRRLRINRIRRLRINRIGRLRINRIGRLRIDRIRRLRVYRIRRLRVYRIRRLRINRIRGFRINRIDRLRINRIGRLRIGRLRGFRINRISQILILLLLIDKAAFVIGNIAGMQCLAAASADKIHAFSEDVVFTDKVLNMNAGHLDAACGDRQEPADRVAIFINRRSAGHKQITVCNLDINIRADNSRCTGTAEVKTAARAAKIQFHRIV